MLSIHFFGNVSSAFPYLLPPLSVFLSQTLDIECLVNVFCHIWMCCEKYGSGVNKTVPAFLFTFSLCSYDLKSLSLDFLELLERFVPSEYEQKLIGNYLREGRPLEELSEEDRFMVRFGRIPRLPHRISTLTFMGNFSDSVQMLQPVSQTLLQYSIGPLSYGMPVADKHIQ